MGRTNLFVIAAVSVLVAACSVANIDGTPLAGSSAAKNGGTAPKTNTQCTPGGAGASDLIKPTDPNTLPKCACAGGGKARCVPKAVLPANLSGQLDTCDNAGPGACVPDELVKSGGAAPKTCKSPFGEGRCMDLCVPEVAKNGALLNRGEGDACAAEERCVPCLNPLKNNEPTGVCEIGAAAATCDDAPADSKGGGGGGAPAVACPYTGPPIVDVKTFPTCGKDTGARCVPANLVPASAGAMLGKCDTGLCAPEKSIAAGGQYLPKTCVSTANAEGRCLNNNIPAVDAQKAQLPQADCDANERCVPCYSPIDGKETGACKSVTCDAPKQAAKTFKACCESQGTSRAKCVPKTMVPQAQQGNLDDDDGTCQKDSELCVPNEMLQPAFKGVACTGNAFVGGNYDGVCLSDCLHFGFIQSLGISRGSCIKGFKCAPCTNPLTNKPTGAPGCPGT